DELVLEVGGPADARHGHRLLAVARVGHHREPTLLAGPERPGPRLPLDEQPARHRPGRAGREGHRGALALELGREGLRAVGPPGRAGAGGGRAPRGAPGRPRGGPPPSRRRRGPPATTLSDSRPARAARPSARRSAPARATPPPGRPGSAAPACRRPARRPLSR